MLLAIDCLSDGNDRGRIFSWTKRPHHEAFLMLTTEVTITEVPGEKKKAAADAVVTTTSMEGMH